MASTFYWAFWNHRTTTELDNAGNIRPLYLIRHLKEVEVKYQAWIKTYYLCLLQFTFSNLLVQVFTVYIFYNLTKKPKERTIDKVDPSSLIETEDVQRLEYLEDDNKHGQSAIEKKKYNQRTASLDQDMVGHHFGEENSDGRVSEVTDNSNNTVSA
jgi:hypothetical protein